MEYINKESIFKFHGRGRANGFIKFRVSMIMESLILFKTGLISGGAMETAVAGLFGRLENREGLLNNR